MREGGEMIVNAAWQFDDEGARRTPPSRIPAPWRKAIHGVH